MLAETWFILAVAIVCFIAITRWYVTSRIKIKCAYGAAKVYLGDIFDNWIIDIAMLTTVSAGISIFLSLLIEVFIKFGVLNTFWHILTFIVALAVVIFGGYGIILLLEFIFSEIIPWIVHGVAKAIPWFVKFIPPRFLITAYNKIGKIKVYTCQMHTDASDDIRNE